MHLSKLRRDSAIDFAQALRRNVQPFAAQYKTKECVASETQPPSKRPVTVRRADLAWTDQGAPSIFFIFLGRRLASSGNLGIGQCSACDQG